MQKNEEERKFEIKSRRNRHFKTGNIVQKPKEQPLLCRVTPCDTSTVQMASHFCIRCSDSFGAITFR